MDGFKSVRALARHHPALLQTKLHEVCLALTEEVLYTFSSLCLCVEYCAHFPTCAC